MVPDIAERVRKIIIMHLAAEETRITEDAKFIGDLGADSLDVFEVTMSFEEEFDVQIPRPRRGKSRDRWRRNCIHQGQSGLIFEVGPERMLRSAAADNWPLASRLLALARRET